jgi:hypothetical protein
MPPRTAEGLFVDIEPVLVQISCMDTYENSSLCIFVIDGSVSFWLWLTLLDTALCGLCPPNIRIQKTTEAALGTSFWIIDIQGTSRRSVRHEPRTFSHLSSQFGLSSPSYQALWCPRHVDDVDGS